MRIISGNKNKLRQKRLRHKDVVHLAELQPHLDILPIRENIHKDIQILRERYNSINRTDSIAKILISKAAQHMDNLKSEREYNIQTNGYKRKQQRILEDMNSIYSRRNSRVRIEFIKDQAIQSTSHSLRIRIHAPVIPMYRAMNVTDDYPVSWIKATDAHKRYNYHYIFQASVPYEMDHPRLGMVRIAYLTYLQSKHRCEKNWMEQGWACQVKSKPSLIAIGNTVEDALALCMKDAAKEIMKDVIK